MTPKTYRFEPAMLKSNRFIFAFLGLLSVLPASGTAESFSQKLHSSVFGDAGRAYGVDPYLLYSVALVESGYAAGQKGYVLPHRYALRSDLGPEFPKTLQDAKKALKNHISKSASLRSVDVCLMQVNLGWNGHRVSQPADLLDLSTCVHTGAAILKDALSSTNSLYEAVGRYHTWADKQASRRYAIKVIKTYNNLPRT